MRVWLSISGNAVRPRCGLSRNGNDDASGSGSVPSALEGGDAVWDHLGTRNLLPVGKEGLRTSMPWSSQSASGSNCILGFICPPLPPMCMPRPRTCTASCNVQNIDPKVFCPDRVLRGPVSASSEDAACREAKRLAGTVTPRGCYKRHCQCSCD